MSGPSLLAQLLIRSLWLLLLLIFWPTRILAGRAKRERAPYLRSSSTARGARLRLRR